MIKLLQFDARGNRIAHSSALKSSFRDPAGFIFEQNNTLYRQVNLIYRDNYDQLMNCGLYDHLTRENMLVRHHEVSDDEIGIGTKYFYKILCPEIIQFISYPYEWCFAQLKDAALLTLDIQVLALAHDMSLKDASAYNIQFNNGRPVMIDTLSFEKYQEGRPWVAYRQFCQHFLATLSLMSILDIRLNKLLRAYIDGIPLDFANTLLPNSTWLNPGLLIHLHLHAKSQMKYSHTDSISSRKNIVARPVSKAALLTILNGLRKTIAKLKSPIKDSEWANYYNATNYSDTAANNKREIVRRFLESSRPEAVWDLGGNTGVYSRIATQMGISTTCFDNDPMAVDLNYQQVRRDNEKLMLPLLLDLTNPSPGLGWAGNERDSFAQRGPVDCIMALALIHHLAISNNLPFERIASFLSELCRSLIIEFVPKEDSQVKRLLSSREDIFAQYDQNCFEKVFSKFFKIKEKLPIHHSHRTLYLMQNERPS